MPALLRRRACGRERRKGAPLRHVVLERGFGQPSVDFDFKFTASLLESAEVFDARSLRSNFAELALLAAP